MPQNAQDQIEPEVAELPATTKLPDVTTPTVKPLAPLKPAQTVAGGVQKLTSTRNPLLTAARTKSRQRPAARGILNSSLAEQAGAQAVIETATPIAAEDAAAEQRREEVSYQTQQAADAETRQAQQRREEIGFQAEENRALSTAERKDTFSLAKAAREQQSKIQEADITSREKLTTEQLSSQLAQLNLQIASTEGIVSQEILAQKEALETEITSREKIVTQQLVSDLEKLNTQISSTEGIVSQEILARKENLENEPLVLIEKDLKLSG